MGDTINEKKKEENERRRKTDGGVMAINVNIK